MNSIEEIVRYQQELLNHQRNQKQIQRETIQLLNALNKTLSLMSDRLDEFEMKTNIKLENNNNNYSSNIQNNTSNNFNYNGSSSNGLNNLVFLNNDLISTGSYSLNSKVTYLLNNNQSNQRGEHLMLNLDTSDVSLKPNIDCENIQSSHILDTSGGTKLNTSDDSTGDISYEESLDGVKETIQTKVRKTRKSNCKNELNVSIKDNKKTKFNDENNNQQRLFNKFVRECVEQKLGKEFLLMHEIQEIDQVIMEQIKADALEAFPPVTIKPRRAWHLAKASLRCRRRSLRRQKEKLANSTTLTPSKPDLLEHN